MTAVLDLVWKMGAGASFVVWCVLGVRLLLVKAPKKWSYFLWILVFARLLIPVFPESKLTLIQPEHSALIEMDTVIHSDIIHSEDAPVTEDTALPVDGDSKLALPSEILRILWPFGTIALLGYGLISYFLLNRKLRAVLRLRDNIYLSDHITSPFVLGLFRPRIYLPSDMDEADRDYVIAHEEYHIRHGDHIVKLAAFLLLSIHWVRPMMWVAFWFLCWDMEMRCDEAVLKQFGGAIRSDYADALLRVSVGNKRFLPAPLAFGEGNPKKRIWNILQWKDPKRWVTILCVVVLLVSGIFLLTDPASEPVELREMAIYTGGDCIFQSPVLSSHVSDGSAYRHIAVCGEGVGIYTDDFQWIFGGSIVEKSQPGGFGFTDTRSQYGVSTRYTPAELTELLRSRMVLNASDLVGMHEGETITVWQFYEVTAGEDIPLYALYWFDEELIWLGEGDCLRLYELQKLPDSGAFAGAVSPWQWTAHLTADDVSYVDVHYWDENGLSGNRRSLNGDEIAELVDLLNGIPRECVTTQGVSAGLLSAGRYERISANIRCGMFSYHLTYVLSDGYVSIMFDQEGMADRYYDSSWFIRNEALNAWMLDLAAELE